MADIVVQKNIGALIDTKNVLTLPDYPWTAGGGSDSATFTSSSVDREGFSTGSMPRSVDVAIFYSATLASGSSLTLYSEVDSAPDNSTWTTYASEQVTLATGPAGGGAVSGVHRMIVQTVADNPVPGPGINLGSAARYVRYRGVPHLTRAGTDTGVISAVALTFGGFDQLAAPTN